MRPFAKAALACILAGAGCRAETPSEARREDAAARGDASKIALQCRGRDDLAPDLAEALETTARSHATALRAGDVEGLWNALHPQARQDSEREAFTESLAAMQQRLAASDASEPELEHLFFVDVSGGVNDLARVRCGGDQAPTLQMMANVGDEDIAVVSLVGRGDPFAPVTTVQLRERGGGWHLVGIQVNPARYRGQSAVDVFALADEHARAGRRVAAYLLLGVAQTLASRGAAIRLPVEERIAAALAVLQEDPAFKTETAHWDVGGDRFTIEGLALAATQSDLSPVVKYVNERGLVEEFLGRDADKLMDHVRTTYPELAAQFDAVVFEAYAERPTRPGASYDAYRLARHFDRSRDAPPPAPAN